MRINTYQIGGDNYGYPGIIYGACPNQENEEEKNEIEAMDMTLCGDADILKVADIQSASRLYEVANLAFPFLKRFIRLWKIFL